ncbi:hypothetical protein BJ138DRAFT_1149994 [Hygrophoropsis aurantiaca]|uniref:Uncharacterized protein n=1 Tax=Hygrophoropsis aurantiaca TaxID=72124 RepID=A0ACB8AEL7_9AGAM|nr:hypothetical protein BJ138DRAFT_1149994 [Hygrophoropsis aurantiaca]
MSQSHDQQQSPGLLHAIWLFVATLLRSFTHSFRRTNVTLDLPSPTSATRTHKVLYLASGSSNGVRRGRSLLRSGSAKYVTAGQRATAGDNSRYPRFSKVYFPVKYVVQDPESGSRANIKPSAVPIFTRRGNAVPVNKGPRTLVSEAHRNQPSQLGSVLVTISQKTGSSSAAALRASFHARGRLASRGPSSSTPPFRRAGFAPLPLHSPLHQSNFPLSPANEQHVQIPSYPSTNSVDIQCPRAYAQPETSLRTEPPRKPLNTDEAPLLAVWKSQSDRPSDCREESPHNRSQSSDASTSVDSPGASFFDDDNSSASSYSDIYDDENNPDDVDTTDNLSCHFARHHELEALTGSSVTRDTSIGIRDL